MHYYSSLRQNIDKSSENVKYRLSFPSRKKQWCVFLCFLGVANDANMDKNLHIWFNIKRPTWQDSQRIPF